MDEFFYKAGNFTCLTLKDFGGSKIAYEIGCDNYRQVIGYQTNNVGDVSTVYGGTTNDVYWIGIITVIVGGAFLVGIINSFIR